MRDLSRTRLVAETAYYYRCRATDTSSRSSGYGYTSGYTSPPPNYAPVWASGWSLTIAAGSSQSIASYASDPNGDSLTFYRNGGNAPTGVTVSLSGSIEVDASTAAGSYTLGLLASDGLLSTSTTCTVTVEAATSTVTFVIPSTTSTWDASVAQTTVSNTSVVPNSVTGAIMELSAGTRTDVATAEIGPIDVVNVEHEEVLLIPRWVKTKRVTFKYGLGDQFIGVLKTLHMLGLDNKEKINVKGVQVSPRDVVAACLPDPAHLGEKMHGKTCAGTWVKGWKDGKPREYYLYQLADNQECMDRWGCQAVVAQTAFNAVIAMDLIQHGQWKGVGVLGPEAFEPVPFMDKMAAYGFPYGIKDMRKEAVV